MVDAVKSPYSGDAYDILTTELNALAVNGWSALSAEFDAATFKQLFRDMVAFLAAPTTGRTDGGTLAIYMVPAVDGVNYADWVGSGTADEPENEQYYVGSITFNAGTGTNRQAIPAIAPIWGGKFKIAVRNKTGDVLAATGNTLQGRRHGLGSQ